MVKRIAVGLTGSLGALALVVAGAAGGFAVGALPWGLLFEANLIGGATLDAALPLTGLALGGVGAWAAVQLARRLKIEIYGRRLARARRSRTTAEAAIVGCRSGVVSGRGRTTRWYRLELQWTDPATGEQRRLERRYVFRKRQVAETFHTSYCITKPHVPVLVSRHGNRDAAIVDVPYAPAWIEMW